MPEAASDQAPAPHSVISTIMTKLAVWQKRVRSHLFWVTVASPRSLWHGTIFTIGWAYTLVVKLPWLIAILVIGTITFQGLTQYATVVNPISVPKDLADRGYTPDVAAQRLRDAMNEYLATVHSHMRNPDIALNGDQPDIVVPTVGISLDAVLSSIRTLLRSTRSRTIRGEITVRQNLLWLRLRLNGHEMYASKTGAEIDKPDDLFVGAVPEILKNIKPYLVAVALWHKDPESSMKFVDEMIDKLTAADEELPWLYNMRGILYNIRKDYPAATEALQTAIHLNSRLLIAHVNLAAVYSNQNLMDQADAQARLALDIDPQDASAHNSYGNLLKKENKRDEAIAEFRKAIAIDPKYAGAHVNLGNSLDARGDHDGAIAEFRQAIAIDPNYATPHNNLGNSLKERGDHDGAIAEFRQAIAIDPKIALPHNNLGISLNARGDHDEAIAEFRQAIAIDPKYAGAHVNLGNSLNARGDHDGAIAEFRQAIAIDPNYATPHNNLGNSLRERGDHEGAIAEYRKAIAIDKNDALAHANLGILLSTTGRRDDAITEFTEALRIDPKSALARHALDNLNRAQPVTGAQK
jgi:tetratricopeptide (TPR) repeat protein